MARPPLVALVFITILTACDVNFIESPDSRTEAEVMAVIASLDDCGALEAEFENAAFLADNSELGSAQRARAQRYMAASYHRMTALECYE